VSVSAGAHIEPGEAIGNVGESHEGAFLHFEVWKNQTRLDPAAVLR
jgi:murein DD-endopeptidase MepM/ murein hydrolase activator NlpD